MRRTGLSDQEKSVARLKELEAYFYESGIVDKDGKIAQPFGCKCYDQCVKSHPSYFYAGQLHHVGKRYDLFCNGKLLRVMVVGQDMGSTQQISLEDRFNSIIGVGRDYRFMRDGQYPARNPHMRGTTSLLRLALCEKLGRDYDGEHLRVDGDTVHIFDCFSLVNFLLCSAVNINVEPRYGAASGCPTRTMYTNCGKHFLAAWRILDPTLVIVQGPAVRGAISDALASEGVVLPVPPACAQNRWHAEDAVKIYGSEVDLISFYHPSAPNGEQNYGNNERTPYLLNVVQPTIERVRKKWCCEGGDGNNSKHRARPDEADPDENPQQRPQASQSDRQFWHDRLDAVLDTNDPLAIAALESLLKYVESRSGQK